MPDAAFPWRDPRASRGAREGSGTQYGPGPLPRPSPALRHAGSRAPFSEVTLGESVVVSVAAQSPS